MAKKTGPGAVRVGVVSDWKKPDKENAPRRCKVGGEWVKVWPEATTGWTPDKKPIKAPNPALQSLGQAAIDGATALVPGYEQDEGQYGITFYAEGSPTIPAPEGAQPRYVLSAEASKGEGGDFGALVTALNMNTIVNAQAAAVDIFKLDVDAALDYLAKLGVPAKKQEAKEEPAPEVEF